MPIPAVCKAQLQVFSYTAHHRPSGRNRNMFKKFIVCSNWRWRSKKQGIKKAPLNLPNQGYQVFQSLLSLCPNTCTTQVTMQSRNEVAEKVRQSSFSTADIPCVELHQTVYLFTFILNKFS